MDRATSEWNTLPSDSEAEPNGQKVADAYSEQSKAPAPIARKLSELVRVAPEADPDELLRHRFLCRGGGLLVAGPTGIGKSAWGLQCALLWAIERPCIGITPSRRLKSLIVQAENDDGDLAEMRDGVLLGLDFTPGQTKTACESVIVCREDTRSGFPFFTECLRPLLAEHKPDLLWIDPALSYLGGESNSQKDVGSFLRNWLNPLLSEFKCGVVVTHHTNKPSSGKEKPDWSGSDFAYLGAGSAEWANWARAVLAIRATGQQGVFELRAGKRGSRIGWRDADQSTSFAKFIGHARSPGVICWRGVDDSEVNAGGRPKSSSPDELLALLPGEGLTTTEWQKLAKDECGISASTFHRGRRDLESAARVLKSKTNNHWQPIKST
jgi:AAA domain